MINMPSAACDAVLNADHPAYEEGGPCHDCALRKGTEASRAPHTAMLVRACVEGITTFRCHVHPGLCRGFIAAVNLRGAPRNENDRRWAEANAHVADILADAIGKAAE